MKETEKAFLWIINILEKKKIPFKISGGFAARQYGVNRELTDIDIEVSNEDIITVAKETKEYIIFGPARYKDNNWDLELLTLRHAGQDIDIAGIKAKIFNQNTKLWENETGNLQDVTFMEIYGKKVPVENLESLIAYKSKLLREVDIEDVRQLKQIKASF